MSSNRIVSRHGDFELATSPAAIGSGFLAWAKMGRIVGNNPIDEPGEYVWFQHGGSREEAKRKLLAELGLSE